MEYSVTALVAVMQRHLSIYYEIESRDVVFRRKIESSERRRIAPWSMPGRKTLRQEEFDLWVALDSREISEEVAIDRMTDLMERYYGDTYPLR